MWRLLWQIMILKIDINNIMFFHNTLKYSQIKLIIFSIITALIIIGYGINTSYENINPRLKLEAVRK